MNSLKTKMMGSYLLVTVLTVAFLLSYLLLYIQSSYMDNIKKILNERAESYSNFYHEYLSDESIINNTKRMQETFPVSDVQMQIYDKNGILLSDSLNMIPSHQLKLIPDVKKALSGVVEMKEYPNENLLALAYPLKRGTTVVGVIRLVTSLEAYHQTIRTISFDFIATGIGIILIVGIISYLLSINITKPIQSLTAAAGEMASGKYSSKVPIKSKDEIGKLADTLNFMAEEIEKREQLKNEFIASVSHDIRTPLTSIRGWVETLNSDDQCLNEEYKEGLSIIENESIRLSAMVEDLLDFSKFSIGKITMDLVDIDLTLLLTSVIKHIEPRALRQSIILHKAFPKISCVIKADEKRLKQILFNLLDNSLKNTPQNGTIIMGYQIAEQTLDMYVEDSGCGILQEDLSKVTQKFFVGKNNNAGSGLGLSIVEEIVKLHQWKLTISSTFDVGTKVVIQIPL